MRRRGFLSAPYLGADVTDPARTERSQPHTIPLEHDHTVLVLQGGGALGGYQAGAYEGLAEADIVPDWIAGVSIGAIKAALTACTRPEHRVDRLRTFGAGKAEQITIAHLINRRLPYSAESKDDEFSRVTVTELWAAGLEDVRRATANIEWAKPQEPWEGVRIYDLTR